MIADAGNESMTIVEYIHFTNYRTRIDSFAVRATHCATRDARVTKAVAAAAEHTMDVASWTSFPPMLLLPPAWREPMLTTVIPFVVAVLVVCVTSSIALRMLRRLIWGTLELRDRVVVITGAGMPRLGWAIWCLASVSPNARTSCRVRVGHWQRAGDCFRRRRLQAGAGRLARKSPPIRCQGACGSPQRRPCPHQCLGL